MEKLNLPYPEAVFDIDYFRKKPKAFYTLAGDLYPGKFEPTKFHHFIKLVEQKGLLKRVYTQNIDTLERIAGVSDEYIVEAHGSFAENHCIDCRAEVSKADLISQMWGTTSVPTENKPAKIPKCKKCGGLVKPDIVFFGEGLPILFFDSIEDDFTVNDVDLAIVAGTSLTVQPFAELPEMVHKKCPRILMNLDLVGDFGSRENDIIIRDTCDRGAELFMEALGWRLGDTPNSSSADQDDDSLDRAEEEVKELAEKLTKVELEDDKKSESEISGAKNTDDFDKGEKPVSASIKIDEKHGKTNGPFLTEDSTDTTASASVQDKIPNKPLEEDAHTN